MLKNIVTLAFVSLGFWAPPAQAGQLGTAVPMSKKGTATYYVPVEFDREVGNDLMVDTGSDYVTINKTTLDLLKERGKVDYVKQVGGTLANGTDISVPIYRIANLNIGCCCILHDVEAAVFEGTERQILGLSALKKVAPFALSVDPAHLILSDCKAHSSELAKN
ncbi:MAG: retroviral-like aspartic protease family protein [Gammaproteobacteria bacterium]